MKSPPARQYENAWGREKRVYGRGFYTGLPSCVLLSRRAGLLGKFARFLPITALRSEALMPVS